jgi:N-acetylneuraminic acid mutarotase
LTRKADILTPRYNLATCAINGKIYAFGGAKDPSGIYASKVEEYDPIDDKWVEKSDMPDPRMGLSACALNGKIYVFGGSKQDDVALSLVDEYDPVKDKWTRKSDMPVARFSFATEAVNGKIYVFGGGTGKWAEGPIVAQVDEYNPAKDTWTRKADIPTPRAILSSFVADGSIYAVGGLIYGPKVLSIVERYDPLIDEWDKVADMPTSRFGLSAGAANDKAYAIGGCEVYGAWFTGIATVEEYTPENWNSVSPQGKLPTKWGEIKK